MRHAQDRDVDPRLLDALLRAGGPMTVQSLALSLDLPIPRVRRELEALRSAGCEIDAHPQHGVTLVRSGLGAWVDYLRDRLGENRLVECYRRTASTQDAARRLVAARLDESDGAVVVADEQSTGRGRLGRRWIAPAGAAVLMSTVVAGGGGVDRMTFAAGVAVCRTLAAFTASAGVHAAIKWPNDVLLDGRKASGILVETVDTPRGRCAIIGIGINSHVLPRHLPDDLRGSVTSLAMLGVSVDRLLVIAEALLAVDRALREPQERLLDEWRRRSTMLHRHVTLQHDGRAISGEVVDLDPDEGLIVRRDSGELVHLPAATTTVVR